MISADVAIGTNHNIINITKCINMTYYNQLSEDDKQKVHKELDDKTQWNETHYNNLKIRHTTIAAIVTNGMCTICWRVPHQCLCSHDN